MPLLQRVIKQLKEKNPTVNFLDLSNSGLFDEDIDVLVPLLKDNAYITTLKLHRNNLSASGTKQLASLTTIHTLILSENDIGDDGVELLAKNKNIKTLNISNNNLHDKGAQILAEYAEQTTLIFDGGWISPQWRNAVEEHIASNRQQQGDEKNPSNQCRF